MSPRRIAAPTQTADQLATRLSVGLGVQLVDERLRRGWTVREVSRRARLAEATIRRLEAGARNRSTPMRDSQSRSASNPCSRCRPGGAAARSETRIRSTRRWARRRPPTSANGALRCCSTSPTSTTSSRDGPTSSLSTGPVRHSYTSRTGLDSPTCRGSSERITRSVPTWRRTSRAASDPRRLPKRHACRGSPLVVGDHPRRSASARVLRLGLSRSDRRARGLVGWNAARSWYIERVHPVRPLARSAPIATPLGRPR